MLYLLYVFKKFYSAYVIFVYLKLHVIYIISGGMFLMFHIVSYQFPPADGHLGSFQIIPIILIWLWCFQVEHKQFLRTPTSNMAIPWWWWIRTQTSSAYYVIMSEYRQKHEHWSTKMTKHPSPASMTESCFFTNYIFRLLLDLSPSK